MDRNKDDTYSMFYFTASASGMQIGIMSSFKNPRSHTETQASKHPWKFIVFLRHVAYSPFYFHRKSFIS
jgi:hypothetical protein